ncbi:hypothetical protein EYF80_058809 [Liparis tanakae]|uniref:Uncharacterized protein n=1 Tax=Liparis tanakae TaxID=230148 RepID=A0A4Z2EQD1_9TELE|nr:hypothetical protein EYF80_058809 [Liparis tanakae]
MTSHLDALVQALGGVDVQPLFAGLQAGDDLLTLDLPRPDGEARQAAPEVLGEPRLGHLPTCTGRYPDQGIQLVRVCYVSFDWIWRNLQSTLHPGLIHMVTNTLGSASLLGFSVYLDPRDPFFCYFADPSSPPSLVTLRPPCLLASLPASFPYSVHSAPSLTDVIHSGRGQRNHYGPGGAERD